MKYTRHVKDAVGTMASLGFLWWQSRQDQLRFCDQFGPDVSCGGGGMFTRVVAIIVLVYLCYTLTFWIAHLGFRQTFPEARNTSMSITFLLVVTGLVLLFAFPELFVSLLWGAG